MTTRAKKGNKSVLIETKTEPKLWAERYPRLYQLLREGDLFTDEGEYVGYAADGQEVSVGRIGDEGKVEQYLATHPGPKDW